MEKQYLQFDINDERAGLIAEVLANKTCKKILSLLAEKEMSESDIAKELGIPANTAHYNIQKLVASGLVETAGKFFWSTKGKKMTIYKLSNKKVVISPKTSFKGIVPALITTAVVAIAVKMFTGVSAPVYEASANSGMAATRDVAVATQEVTMGKMAESSASYGMDSFAATMPQATDAVVQTANIASIAPWSWFLLGAWAALLVFVLFNIRRNSSN